VPEVESLLTGSSLLDDLMGFRKRWEERLKAYQDSEGKVTAPRWAKCWEMWQELDQVVSESRKAGKP
jgi:hypothetical protein